ncbi:hypothetical protein ACFYO2_02905 [Streptomyces sp. NPDC006602]|uniref:hypothetical protein n=1 Tax=Streptomyces sp. NPDC006602 TaxID=3364751 RepID=UPI00367CA824
MELRRRVARTALSRPGVLLAVSPGATRERLALEAELVRREWPTASTPAEADLLVVLNPGHAEDPDWVMNLWQAMSAPKARALLTNADQVATVLDQGLAALRDGMPHRRDHETHLSEGHGGHEEHASHDDQHHMDGEHEGHASHGHDQHHMDGEHDQHPEDGGHHEHESHGGHGGHEGHDTHDGHGGHDAHGGHGGHDTHAGHGGHDAHGGHGGHDAGHGGHAGHDMGGVVAGLPMADRADDRDGLRLDRLHVPLGPGLADWPAGLVLRLVLQGDVIQQVGVESAESMAPASPRPPFWSEPWIRAVEGERVTRGDAARRLCAAHLDSLGRFFAVAGWADMAARARHVRDSSLAGADAAELSALTRPLIRRAERSRSLRWLTAGLGPLAAEHAAHLGITGPALVADGDAHSRMLVWLDAVGRSAAACDDAGTLDQAEAIGPRGRIDRSAPPPSRPLLDALPGLLEGTEFACARIIVASLDPDLDEPAYVPAAGAAPHG